MTDALTRLTTALTGVALVAPFDLGRFAITGAATPVLEGVQLTVGSGFALLA